MRLALTAVLALSLLTGCADESICGGDQYPAKAVGNATGRACVPKGEDPPAGYVRYPAGQEPEHVGDKWDEYWETKVVDQTGRIISG